MPRRAIMPRRAEIMPRVAEIEPRRPVFQNDNRGNEGAPAIIQDIPIVEEEDEREQVEAQAKQAHVNRE